ncbi:Dynactin subunit 4, partial [Xenoophorus captivus]
KKILMTLTALPRYVLDPLLSPTEYDELAEPQDFQDDPEKSNKIGFFIKVIPQKEEDTDVTVSFRMRHDFRNLAAPIRPSEEGGDAAPEAIWLTHHVELRLGPLAP